MKVGVVGNCQSGIMASLLTAMLPDKTIAHHSIAQPQETFAPAASDLASCEIVITQYVSPDFGPLSTDALKDLPGRLIIVPNIAFTGFHPDITYMSNKSGHFISPAGFYHSKIIVAGFMLGLSAARTAKLFNSHIYHRLGYFDEFDMAGDHFESAAAGRGFSLKIRDLLQKGVFMHTINHAAISATESLTLEAARIAGLSPKTDYDPLPDTMTEDTVWPVYPEIARRIGLDTGSLLFRMAAPMAQERTRDVELDEMIQSSFDIYASQRDEVDFAPIQKIAAIIGDELRTSYN